jgi:hypothetical protein
MRVIKAVLALSLLYFVAMPINYANDASDIVLTCTSINKDLNETEIWLLNIENQTIKRSDPFSDDALGQFQIIKSDNKSLIWEQTTPDNRSTYVLDKNTMRQSVTFLSINEHNKMTLKNRSFSSCFFE